MTGFSNKPFPQNKVLVIYRGKFSRLSGHSQKKEKFWGDDPALGKCHLHNNAQWHQAVESIWNNDAHCTPAVPRLPPSWQKSTLVQYCKSCKYCKNSLKIRKVLWCSIASIIQTDWTLRKVLEYSIASIVRTIRKVSCAVAQLLITAAAMRARIDLGGSYRTDSDVDFRLIIESLQIRPPAIGDA